MSDDATCSSLGPGQGLTVIAAKIKLAVALVATLQHTRTTPQLSALCCRYFLFLAHGHDDMMVQHGSAAIRK